MSHSAYGSAVPFAAPPSGSSTAYTSLGQALTSTSSTVGPRTGHQSSPEPTTYDDTQRIQSQMASEHRSYYSTAHGPTPQGYPPYTYPTQVYEAAYPNTTTSRPVRNDSSHSESPQQHSQSEPPNPYGLPPSSIQPQTQQQPYPTAPLTWNGTSWVYISQPLQSPDPSQYQQPERGPEATQPPASTPAESRVPLPSPPKNEVRRDERSPRPLESAPPPNKIRKVKDQEVASAPTSLPPAQPPPAAVPELDFLKILEAYKLIMDHSHLLSRQPQTPPPADSVERMLESARFGAQALDAAAKRAAAEAAREVEKCIEEVDTKPTVPPSDQPAEGQTCLGCHATSTPEWRRGPMGPRTLCNACGLVYAKMIKKRSRDPTRSRGSNKKGNKSAHHDNGQLSSGSEDSYDSPERRSEAGDHGGA